MILGLKLYLEDKCADFRCSCRCFRSSTQKVPCFQVPANYIKMGVLGVFCLVDVSRQLLPRAQSFFDCRQATIWTRPGQGGTKVPHLLKQSCAALLWICRQSSPYVTCRSYIVLLTQDFAPWGGQNPKSTYIVENGKDPEGGLSPFSYLMQGGTGEATLPPVTTTTPNLLVGTRETASSVDRMSTEIHRFKKERHLSVRFSSRQNYPLREERISQVYLSIKSHFYIVRINLNFKCS